MLDDAPTQVWMPASTVFVDSLADVTAIYTEGVTLCVLNRSLPPSVARFARDTLLSRDLQLVVPVVTARPELPEFLPGLAAAPGYEAFRADICDMIGWYGELFAADEVGLRLYSTGADMCQNFHIDRVGVRLVCTYAGPGTEWLVEADVDRTALGQAYGDPETVMRDGATIHRLTPGAVGLFKGEAWPGNAGHGLVHRSPAIAGRGERRVLITLDAL